MKWLLNLPPEEMKKYATQTLEMYKGVALVDAFGAYRKSRDRGR